MMKPLFRSLLISRIFPLVVFLLLPYPVLAQAELLRQDSDAETRTETRAETRAETSIEPREETRPNILWISSEDNGPHLGCYGDSYATTPNLDAFAKSGTVYLNVWSNAPVCAPARTAIITGMYPTSLGAEHMRSLLTMPKGTKLFPQIMREQGYYCTNNRKEDYNVKKTGKVWDQSNGKAHWRNRPDDKPFFAVVNHTISHESQIRKRPHQPIHDPSKVRVPAYHPDHKDVRQDWAQYYDKVQAMDKKAGHTLSQLKADGLLEDTIVFYFGDHGSGMPRSKRFPGNSGLSVPLIVYIPEKFKHLASDDFVAGGQSDRLVSFVDFGPTVLSLAGIKTPESMQGKAFLGNHQAQPKQYLHGFRGRMDERYDMVRVVRNKQFIYVRNFYPQRTYAQHVHYQFQTPTTKIWHELFQQGKLNRVQSAFWQSKPLEEIYDLENDPDETINLAAQESVAAQNRLLMLRNECKRHCHEILDLGFIPEPEMHKNAKDLSPRDVFGKHPQQIKSIIDRVFGLPAPKTEMNQLLESKDATLRFWGLHSIEYQGEDVFREHQKQVSNLTTDPSGSVRVMANYLLLKFGGKDDAAAKRLIELADLRETDAYTTFMALNAIDYLDQAMLPYVAEIKKLPPTTDRWPNPRVRNYPQRLKEKILNDLKSEN